jgi:tRNA(fMet)-specific endonuclease VapC
MNGRYLLDTNIVVALFRQEPDVQRGLAAADEVFIPAIVLGELYYGAGKSSRPGENTARVDEFATERSVLGCDAEVAREYGAIRNELRVKGRPLPENDLWIAAIARRHDLVLVTRDNHFRELENLSVEAW